MNRIFKIVWNRTQGRAVVASELACGHAVGSSGQCGNENEAATERGASDMWLAAWALALPLAFPLMGYAPQASPEPCAITRLDVLGVPTLSAASHGPGPNPLPSARHNNHHRKTPVPGVT